MTPSIVFLQINERFTLLHLLMNRKKNQASSVMNFPTRLTSGNVSLASQNGSASGHVNKFRLPKSFSETCSVSKRYPSMAKMHSVDDDDCFELNDEVKEALNNVSSYSNYGAESNESVGLEFNNVSDIEDDSASETSIDVLRRQFAFTEDALMFPDSVAQKLAVNTIMAARVTDLNAPSKFWIQLKEHFEVYDKLQEELK